MAWGGPRAGRMRGANRLMVADRAGKSSVPPLAPRKAPNAPELLPAEIASNFDRQQATMKELRLSSFSDCPGRPLPQELRMRPKWLIVDDEPDQRRRIERAPGGRGPGDCQHGQGRGGRGEADNRDIFTRCNRPGPQRSEDRPRPLRVRPGGRSAGSPGPAECRIIALSRRSRRSRHPALNAGADDFTSSKWVALNWENPDAAASPVARGHRRPRRGRDRQVAARRGRRVVALVSGCPGRRPAMEPRDPNPPQNAQELRGLLTNSP